MKLLEYQTKKVFFEVFRDRRRILLKLFSVLSSSSPENNTPPMFSSVRFVPFLHSFLSFCSSHK